VGDHQYAMDILHLREVGRMPQIEPEPGAPEGVLGVARLHGQPVRVRELARSLGEPGRYAGAAPAAAVRPWLIVTRGEKGDLHWLVDAVQDIVEYDPVEIRVGAAEADSRTAGLIEIDGRLTYLLTPDVLGGRRAP
jgi:chemotaxis signal transduction protein